tara:strand:+ start:2438 stop:3061 length:624 start_codon:yes stop_codon:yes gene_type:complete
MADNTKVLSIHKSRNTLLDILNTRGFNIEQYKGFSISEIHALFMNKQLDMIINDDNGKKVYIKYYLDKSIRPSNIHDIIDDLFNIEQLLSKTDELIIIIKDEPNDSLRKLQNSIYAHEQVFITIINIERLQFNILNHNLVPKHRVLSHSESNEIRKQYNIVNDSNIPSISRFDPVSQVIGIRPHEICEIERPSKSAITSKFYRICSL